MALVRKTQGLTDIRERVSLPEHTFALTQAKIAQISAWRHVISRLQISYDLEPGDPSEVGQRVKIELVGQRIPESGVVCVRARTAPPGTAGRQGIGTHRVAKQVCKQAELTQAARQPILRCPRGVRQRIMERRQRTGEEGFCNDRFEPQRIGTRRWLIGQLSDQTGAQIPAPVRPVGLSDRLAVMADTRGHEHNLVLVDDVLFAPDPQQLPSLRDNNDRILVVRVSIIAVRAGRSSMPL